MKHAGKIQLAFATAVLITCNNGWAQSENAPFTFDVEVNVKAMHRQVTAVHVRCGVYGAQEGVALALGETTQPVKSRDFNGFVKVPVSMINNHDPLQADRYTCRLRLIKAGGAPLKPSPQAGDIVLRPSSRDPFVPIVEGKL